MAIPISPKYCLWIYSGYQLIWSKLININKYYFPNLISFFFLFTTFNSLFYRLHETNYKILHFTTGRAAHGPGLFAMAVNQIEAKFIKVNEVTLLQSFLRDELNQFSVWFIFLFLTSIDALIGWSGIFSRDKKRQNRNPLI